MFQNTSAIHQMAWRDYIDYLKPDFLTRGWTSRCQAIESFHKLTNRLETDEVPMDPVVAPYMAQVFTLLCRFPDAAAHSIYRQLDPISMFPGADNKEVIGHFCQELLLSLKSSNPGKIITTSLVRDRLTPLMAAMPESVYSERLRHHLHTDIALWLDTAINAATRATCIPMFDKECTTAIQRYVDHATGSLSGSNAHSMGTIVPVDEEFLAKVENHLHVKWFDRTEFRTDTLSRIKEMSYSHLFDPRKPLPYTAYKPLQYAVERFVIGDYQFAQLKGTALIDAAKLNLKTLFGMEDDQSRQILDWILS